MSSTNASTNFDRINPLLLPLPWLVVALLVAIFVAFKYSGTDDTSAVNQKVVKEFPQIYIYDVDVRQYDNSGKLHYQMSTPLIRHFQPNDRASAQDYSLFQTPNFTLINDPKRPAWFITAKEGRRDENGLWFYLTEDVVAHQTSETQGDITINTSELRLNTKDQFAETTKAVTMRAAKSQIQAMGMRADIQRNHIELLSHVKGTYEP